jgi:hypothetical protein
MSGFAALGMALGAMLVAPAAMAAAATHAPPAHAADYVVTENARAGALKPESTRSHVSGRASRNASHIETSEHAARKA